MDIHYDKEKVLSKLTKIVSTITIVLILIGVLFTLHMLGIAEQFGQTYMVSTAKQTADNIRVRMRNDFQTLSRLSRDMSAKAPTFSEKSVTKFLTDTIDAHPDSYHRLSFTYPNGKNIRVQSSIGIIEPNVDVTKLACWEVALNGDPCFQDSYKEPVSRSGMVNRYYIPVYDELNTHKIVGVLGVMFDTDMFANVLDISNFGNKAYTHIVNHNGDYLVKSNHEKNFSKNYFNQEIHFIGTTADKVLRNIGEKPFGTFWYKSGSGKKYLSAYADAGNGAYVISDIPKDVIMLNFNRILLSLLIIIFIVGALLMFQLRYTENMYKKNEEALYKMAFVDDVTESHNKAKFVVDTRSILADKNDANFAVISMDVTKFKVINELYGFKRSNTILKDICSIIKKNLSDDSVCARDFAATFVILYKYNEEVDIINFINKVVEDVEKYNSDVMVKLVSNAETSVVSKLALCFGIYIVRDKTMPINIMCDRASIAKRNINGDVVNIYRFYDDGLRSKILQDKAIEDEMHNALANGQYKMFLQPKFDLNTLELAGAEALVRWVHPSKGIIPPNDFIPVFEKNGFIIELDKCIWRQACQFLAERKSNNLKLFPISVNVSRLHLNNDIFIDGLFNLTQEYDIDPKYLELEVTESACFDNTKRFSDIIHKLKADGFKISMDDFGVGYSSLNMLRNLPVDILKLDRGFITDTIGAEDKKGEVVIKNILKMADELGIVTVGEGVETPEQAEFLKNNGCKIVQGFLYGKPVNIDDFTKLFLEGRDTGVTENA